MKQVFLDMFFKQVTNRGNEMAVEDPGSVSLSYAQLNDWSDRVYRYLVDKGIGKEDVVVINLPRGAYEVAAIIGVMRAGAVFTVVEDAYTVLKMDAIIEESEPILVLNEERWKEVAAYEERSGEVSMTYCEVDEHDAAYIVFTSGSTGKPKGCIHEYGGLVGMMKSADYEGKPPIHSGRYALIAPLSYISMKASLFMTLAYGVTVVMVPLKLLAAPSQLAAFFKEQAITSTSLFPTLARAMMGMKLELEHIAVGREPANGVFFENCLVINYYATSECGCMVTAFKISHLYEKDIPIGKPQFELQYRVEPLEEADGGEQENQTGELVLYLPYFRGYIKMPEKTAEVMQDHWYHTGDIVSVREDGNLILLGRKGNRFCIKGVNMELEEVEQDALNVLENVSALAVQGFGEGESAYLCLYYEAETDLDVENTRAKLAKQIPDYMIPEYYIRLESLPKLSNGKVDRKVLKAPK